MSNYNQRAIRAMSNYNLRAITERRYLDIKVLAVWINAGHFNSVEK
jgi:hypothetical protein